MNKIYNYFKNLNILDFNHAYIICNTTYEECKDDLEKTISKFLFNVPTNIDDNPDIYLIQPEENFISKKQIEQLLINLTTTSQISGKKLYILTQCEKLSPSVYNALLKTIEEPGENIYAILITSNIDSVVTTIKSRCHVILVSSECSSINKEISEFTLNMLERIKKNGINSIGKDCDLYYNIKDREEIRKIVFEMYYYYINVLKETSNNIEEKNKIKEYCKKALSIDKIIRNLDFNVNKDLIIDKIIIDAWRCNNEISVN